MIRKIIKSLLIIFFFLYISPSCSQEQDGLNMSLADCITLALKNNFTLIQEKNTLEVRYRRLQEKNLGRLPVFNFLSSNSYTIRETLPSPVYEAGINMKQPVYDRGTIGYDQEEALINYQKQILRYETRQNNVIYTADTYYYNLIGQDKLLIISQTSLEDSKKLLDISQARFKAGDIAEIEVLKAQVQVAQSEDDILTRQARRDTARDSLVRYLELDFGAEIIPTENIEYVSFNFNLEDCLNIAFNRRPEIKSTLLDVELAQIIYNREKSTILPEVALTGNLKYRGQHGITPATTYQFYISGIWEFPLYDRGKRSNTLRDYEANIEIAKINYEEVQKDIILEVRNSFRDLKSNENKIELRNKIVLQAEQNLEATQLQYKMGLATILDVTTTTQSLTSARVNALQSLIDFQLSKEKLSLVLGTIGDPWRSHNVDEGME